MLATGMCFIPAKQLGVRWQDLLKFIDVRQGRPSRWRTGQAPPPRPVPGQQRVAVAAGLESREGPGWSGRIPEGRVCWPSVKPHSGKVWMNDQLASHTQTFHPSIWDRWLQVMSEWSYLRDERDCNSYRWETLDFL